MDQVASSRHAYMPHTRTDVSPTTRAMTSDSMWYESPMSASELVT